MILVLDPVDRYRRESYYRRVPRQLAYQHQQYDAAAMLAEMGKTRYLLESDSASELGLASALNEGLMRSSLGDAAVPGIGTLREAAGRRAVPGIARGGHGGDGGGGRVHAPHGLAAAKQYADAAGAVLAGTPHMTGAQLHPYRDWDRRMRLQLASSGKNGFRNVHGDLMWLPAHRSP